MTTTRDWRTSIADSARSTLSRNSACIVRLDTNGPRVVSRAYMAADYEGGTRQMRKVAVTRATRMLNTDEWNYYVVAQYDEEIVVWTGMHSILVEVPA